MTDSPLRRSIGWYRIPILIVAVLTCLLFYLPFLVVVATSWTGTSYIIFPPEGFSLQSYIGVLGDVEWMDAFKISLRVAGIGTVIAVLLGTLGALALTRLRSRAARRWIRTLFIVPMAIPPVAYAVGLYSVSLRATALQDNLGLLILGEALLAVPYVFVMVSSGLSQADPALRPVASTLGAGWPMIVWRVDLPMIAGHMLAGAVFAFAVIFDEVVLSVFLTPVGVKTLPLQMLTASQEELSPQLTAASTLVSMAAVLLLGGYSLFSSRRAARARRLSRKAATV
ncbi:ABC transporter permease subunit [Micromonospora zingiberis]|uniref:ABC transporter permease subunit n=1 Tax=Micromonospora zingiberis TaxID=2053011 RepID=A0A4R0GJ65_9ACTN|nr:ABC transporter permease subunit [Micromonospora zingiberis]TCB97246.1 ABC transporter permease subunit [Micromonospora zingiberis]